ncbi:hypothetical protein [Polymorphum gilvum]|nr:hypothetical protein [Polymorphum gilvum]
MKLATAGLLMIFAAGAMMLAIDLDPQRADAASIVTARKAQ